MNCLLEKVNTARGDITPAKPHFQSNTDVILKGKVLSDMYIKKMWGKIKAI